MPLNQGSKNSAILLIQPLQFQTRTSIRTSPKATISQMLPRRLHSKEKRLLQKITSDAHALNNTIPAIHRKDDKAHGEPEHPFVHSRNGRKEGGEKRCNGKA